MEKKKKLDKAAVFGITPEHRLPDIGRNCIIDDRKSRMKNRNSKAARKELMQELSDSGF